LFTSWEHRFTESQQVSESAGQQVGKSAKQRISKSASQQISKNSNLAIWRQKTARLESSKSKTTKNETVKL
jgi:hypothetical protein